MVARTSRKAVQFSRPVWMNKLRACFFCNETQAANLEPLKGLTALRWLYLTRTPAKNLEPIYDPLRVLKRTNR